MNEHHKKLGLWMLTALVAGNMIGSGVFMLPAALAKVGSISLLSWIFTSFGAMALALVFAKMSFLIPKTGGPYAYALEGFGEYMGFQTAYYYWIMIWTGNAAIAVAFTGYLQALFPIFAHPTAGFIATVSLVWILTAINIIGVNYAGSTQIVTTILKFIPLIIVATLGWFFFHPDYITNSFNLTKTSNFSAFSYGATLTLWAFVGVESATVPAGSVVNPQRNIPLATLIGTGAAVIIYLITAIAISGILPANILANSASPFAAATEVILGKWGKIIVAFGACISCLGALNGWILLQGQVPMAASEDNLFPKRFAKRNKKGVPTFGLIVSSILITGLLFLTQSPNLVDQFQQIILLTSVACLIGYLYTAISEIIILPKREIVSKKNGLHLLVAVFAAIYSFWAIFGSGKEVIFYIMIFIFSSLPLYAWLHWRKHRQKAL